MMIRFVFVFALVTVLVPSANGDTILNGVARTVEDIGGQIVGNPAAKRNDALLNDLDPGKDVQDKAMNLQLHPAELPTPDSLDKRLPDLDQSQSEFPEGDS